MKRTLAILGLVAAAGCGKMGMGGPTPADALVIFRNESLDQADVYAVAPGTDFVRIGTVFPGRSDTLRVRSSMLASGSGVNIVARLLAHSITPSSGNITLRPGDMIEVRLPADERTLVAVPVASP